MNVPPATKPAPAMPVVKVTLRIAWDTSISVLQAELSAHFPNEVVPVTWSGKTDDLPFPLQGFDAVSLATVMEAYAQRTGGAFTQKQDGLWPAMDEVR